MLHFRLDLFKSAHLREPRPLMQPCSQLVELLSGTDGIGLHSSVIEIPDPAGHPDVLGASFHERAESDTLDTAGYQPSAC